MHWLLLYSPVALPTWPAGHGSGFAAPLLQKEPVRHSMHTVPPSSDWKVPTAQLMHVSALAFGLNVPGAHGVATADPTEQKVPRGQTTHWSILLITTSDAFL